MRFKKHWFAILFAAALFGFTAYLLADTFLIARAYTVVESAASTPQIQVTEAQESETVTIVGEATAKPEATEEPAATPVVPETTETTYRDENISVELSTYRLYDTTVYVADVQVTSADYLKTAFAESTYGRNITDKTSSMADSVGAILAINGDYYGAQRSGYVIRNGVLYRATSSGDTEDLVIYRDGSFGIVNESEVTAEALLENGAWNVLSFGPGLVVDGEIAVSVNEEVGRAMASNPRTAIGIIDDLHYVFVVADGRTSESDGLSLHQLASFMTELGVKTAYNLDGGGSSSMVFCGTLINNPTTNGKRSSERSVSDIVYIGY